VVCSIFPFSDLNLFNRGVATSAVRASDEPGLEESESVVCAYSNDGHFLGRQVPLVAIGEAMPTTYASVIFIVPIHQNILYSLLSIGDAFYNLPNGHIMRGKRASKEEKKVLGGHWVHPALLETCSKQA
jgi:hypothetical protein